MPQQLTKLQPTVYLAFIGLMIFTGCGGKPPEATPEEREQIRQKAISVSERERTGS